MKSILTVFFTLLITSGYSQTQAEMNKQAYANYQKADKELNEVYKKILVQYKADAAFITNLKASQRIWVSFRDAELKMKYPEGEGNYYGSMHPVCQAVYLEELTCQRTAKLQQWLTGPKDGEACFRFCAGEVNFKFTGGCSVKATVKGKTKVYSGYLTTFLNFLA